ncbi:MAG: type II secretion system F family protein [Propionibacteriaceae bacterium]|nr:type II secretion system F family protein [Propionibacteriaceae bacterium]
MADPRWYLLAAAAVGLAILCWRSSPGVRLRPGPDRRQPVGSRRRLLQAVAVAASALPLAIGLGWVAAPVAAALGGASWWVLGRLQAGGVLRRRELLAAELPQVCDLLAVCLESGLPLRTAATELARVHEGPLGAALAEVSATVRLGADEARAWADLAMAEPALSALGREVSRTLGSGVTLAATLRTLGAEARRAAQATALVRARRVGVRSVLPLMLCFLPAFLLLGVVPIVGGVAGHLFG